MLMGSVIHETLRLGERPMSPVCVEGLCVCVFERHAYSQTKCPEWISFSNKRGFDCTRVKKHCICDVGHGLHMLLTLEPKGSAIDRKSVV